jgi:CRP-like cAMP-binding protein
VVACDHCLVASMPSDLLWNLMDARPKIMKLLLKRLARTIRDISVSTAILLAQST